jgi:diguanylate cyclase (GGDEF)-like protein
MRADGLNECEAMIVQENSSPRTRPHDTPTAPATLNGRACAEVVPTLNPEDPMPRSKSQSANEASAAEVAIMDWDDLFSAVEARLRLTVDVSPGAGAELQAHDSVVQVRASVLECVMELDHLHSTLKHVLGRTQRLELEVFDAQTALAQLRAELVGTQAGERRARHLALHDTLTSLPNGGYFRERLDHALARAEAPHHTLAVLYLDLDGFKPINDAHGHAAGDELLRIVAARLARAVRAEDMVSRLGGDEFACLLGGLPSRDQLSHLACKLFDAVSAPFQLGELKLSVRPSIGIAMCPADGTTSDALIKNADTAMYRAKRGQVGYAFFDPRADHPVARAAESSGRSDRLAQAVSSVDCGNVT